MYHCNGQLKMTTKPTNHIWPEHLSSIQPSVEKKTSRFSPQVFLDKLLYPPPRTHDLARPRKFWLKVSPTPFQYIVSFLPPGKGAEKVAAVSMSRPDAYCSSTT